MTRGPFTVGVISETFLVRQGLLNVLHGAKFKYVVPLGSPRLSTESLHASCARIERVDLVFFDVHMIEDGEEGLLPDQVISILRTSWPDVKVVGLGTLLELAAQAECLDASIEFKDASPVQLIDIASTIASRGRLPAELSSARDITRESARWRALSRRERQVLSLLGCGSDNLKMAAELTISESSIKGYVSSLLRKFNADNRSELGLIARAAGLGRWSRNSSFRRD